MELKLKEGSLPSIRSYQYHHSALAFPHPNNSYVARCEKRTGFTIIIMHRTLAVFVSMYMSVDCVLKPVLRESLAADLAMLPSACRYVKHTFTHRRGTWDVVWMPYYEE